MISRWILLKMRNVWDISRRENQIHSFRFNKSPPTKSCGLWGNVEKYGTARQDTDDNTPRALRMLDNLGYKNTQNIWYLLLSHGNSGFANASRCYVYAYIPSVVSVFFKAVVLFVVFTGSKYVEHKYANNDVVTLWHWNTFLAAILTIHIPTEVRWYFGSHHHHHHHALTDLFLLRLIVSSKVVQFVFVHLVYSTLFLAPCCSFSLSVVANLICIFLVSRQVVYFQHFEVVFIPPVAKKGVPGCSSETFWILLRNGKSCK